MRLRAVLMAVCGLLVLSSPSIAQSLDGPSPGKKEKYAQSPHKQWFEGWKNKAGTSCCGASDCFREVDENGKRNFYWRNSSTSEGYEIQILPSDKWIPVPEYAVDPNQVSPFQGLAVACYRISYFYCFSPPVVE